MSSSRARTIPESFRVFLLKLLLDHGDGISVAKFASHFMKSRGDRIKYELYGYSSLIDMLEDLPDVCRVDRTSNTVMLYPVDDALKIRLRYQLDKRPAKPEDPELDSIRKVATSLGEVILLKIEDEIYVPTCCLAQLAGCTTDRVLENLEEDGLKVSNVRYLTVGNKEHEEFRLRIALWCPLACSDPQQIDEKLAVVPLASCDFILGSMIPDIPQDNAVRKLRILSSFRLNYV